MLRLHSSKQAPNRRRNQTPNRCKPPLLLPGRHCHGTPSIPHTICIAALASGGSAGGSGITHGGDSGSTHGDGSGSNSSHGRAGGSSMANAQPQEQVLSFTNPQGERLAAKLLDAGSDDVVIFCHGYAATKDGFLFPRLAAELAAKGKSSLRFDFAGNGESEGSFSFGNYYHEVEDLRAAVTFVRNTLHKTVHAIVGHSKGGNVVLLYASRYDDVPNVVNIAGRGLMSRGIQERFGSDILERLAREGAVEQEVRADGGRRIKYMLTKESVDERMRMDMFAEASKITVSRVLTVHGSTDSVIPVEDAHGLATRIRRHSLTVVEGGDHNFRQQPAAAAQLLARVTEYLVMGA